MTFPIYRFRSNISCVIIASVILLSLQVKVAVACENQHKSKNILPVNEVALKNLAAIEVTLKRIVAKKIADKKVWIQYHTPSEKKQPATDQEVHAKIKSVITDYKTGLDDYKKDQITQHILKQGKKYGYDPLFLTALIITESSFNHRAKSKAGALGLMQIRPNTGKAMAVETNIRWRGTRTLYRPEKNIALGSFYLSKLVNRFGDMKTALEAYNHGPTRTARYLRRGKKTQKYSGKVFAIYNQIKLAKVDS